MHFFILSEASVQFYSICNILLNYCFIYLFSYSIMNITLSHCFNTQLDHCRILFRAASYSSECCITLLRNDLTDVTKNEFSIAMQCKQHDKRQRHFKVE